MRETMKNIIYSLLITTMIASCGDAPEEYSDTETLEKPASNSLQYINITNAKSLYISSSSGRTTSRGRPENKLFKITEDGAVEEVEYFNEDNSTYTVTNQPLAVDVVDTDYIVFSFGDYINDPTSCYLVKKSTGEVHILGRVIDPIVHADCPLSQTNSREKKILTDSKENLYYRYYGVDYSNEDNETYYRLRKVNYSNPKNVVATQITNDNESIENFVVDSEGNIAYNIMNRNSKVFWIGFDGNIKYDNTDANLTMGHYKLYQDDKLILFDPMGNGKYIIDNGKELVTKELTTSLLIQFLLDIKCQHTFECSSK